MLKQNERFGQASLKHGGLVLRSRQTEKPKNVACQTSDQKRPKIIILLLLPTLCPNSSRKCKEQRRRTVCEIAATTHLHQMHQQS